MRRLGYGIAVLTLGIMLLQAIIGSIGGHPDAPHRWAYLVFITPATVGFLILGMRGRSYAGWGLLIPAFGAEQAADFGLTSYWYFAVAFVVATFLTQVMPLWHDLPREGTRKPRLGPPADE